MTNEEKLNTDSNTQANLDDVRRFVPSVKNFSKDTTQVLKGLLAVGIVLYHMTKHFVPWFDVYGVVHGAGTQIVSVFFFLSGYGLLASYQAKGKSYLEGFLSKRLSAIILPFIVAAVLFQVLFFFTQGYSRIGECFFNVRGWMYILPFCWFAIAIIYFYVAFYIVFRFLTDNALYGTILMCVFIFIYALYMGRFDGCLWNQASFAVSTGMFCKYYEKEFLHFLQSRWRTFFFIAAVLLVHNYSFVLDRIPYSWIFPLLLKWAVFPLLPIMILYHTGLPKWRPLPYLGNISYEIYLVHGIAMFCLRDKHHYCYIQNDYLFIALTLLSAFLLASGLHWAVNQLKVTNRVKQN